MKRLTHYNEKDKRYDIKNAYLEDLEQDLKYDGIAWLRIYEAYQELGKLEDIEEKHNISSLDDLDKKLTILEIIKKHKLLNYVLKNEKCANMYHLSKEEIDLLREIENGND